MTDPAARAAELLRTHRASIDRLDAILVYTLAERFRHTQEVGALKAAHDLPAADPAREAAQIARLEQLATEAGLDPDFYVKTLHHQNYWSKQQPDQDRDVIDNYAIDNYWCKDPEETIGFMSEVERPWIAYKVLAAGAIHPRSGFRYAFENGADFAAVGMFDFQIAEDVAIANEILEGPLNRDREWLA